MSIVNEKLLSAERVNDLLKVGLSEEPIASAARDKTGDSSISERDISLVLYLR